MSEERSFDPRFDPAFQRGYDASERARRTSAAPSLTAEDIAFGRSALPELGSPLVSAPPPPPEGWEGPKDQEAQAAPTVRRNPFILTLWIISVVLVLGGMVLVIGSGRIGFSSAGGYGSSPEFMVAMQTVSILCPAMTTVGLATMSGLLFWHASRWTPSPR